MLIKARWFPYVMAVLVFLFAMLLMVHETTKVYTFSAGDLVLRFGESKAGTFEAAVFNDNPNLSCKLYVQKGKQKTCYELKPNVYQTYSFSEGSGDYDLTLYRQEKSGQKKGDYVQSGKVTVNVDMSGIIVGSYGVSATNVSTNAKVTAKTSVSYDPVWEMRSYTHTSGKTMNYWINVPEGATSGMPVVLFLHGDGEMGKANAVAKLKQVQYMRESKDFIGIAPVGQNSDWNSDKVQQTLKGILDECISKYQIDTSRVYIWGFSQGAIGTWGMVDRYGSFFAAAVPVSCGSRGSIKAESFLDTKVYALAGSKEGGYISKMKAIVDKIVTAGGDAKFESVAGQNHHTITANFPYEKVIDEWLLLQ